MGASISFFRFVPLLISMLKTRSYYFHAKFWCLQMAWTVHNWSILLTMFVLFKPPLNTKTGGTKYWEQNNFNWTSIYQNEFNFRFSQFPPEICGIFRGIDSHRPHRPQGQVAASSWTALQCRFADGWKTMERWHFAIQHFCQHSSIHIEWFAHMYVIEIITMSFVVEIIVNYLKWSSSFQMMRV